MILPNITLLLCLKENQTKNFKILKKRGDYVIASIFGDNNEIKWGKKFNIVELGGIDDEHITSKILQKTQKLAKIIILFQKLLGSKDTVQVLG